MKWDLTYLFETEQEFLASLEKLKGYVEKLASYRGKLSDEESLVEYLTISRDFEEAFGRTYQYASLKSDLNKKDIQAASNLNNCIMIIYGYSEACSFQDPEILALGKEKVMDIINRHPEIDMLCSRGGTIRFLTTESVVKFASSASIFLNKPIIAEHITL
jgi:oligoendopeptidase F